MVGFLNTYFQMLKFIEITYITNKCNQYVICLFIIPPVRLFIVTFKQLYLHTHLKLDTCLCELIYSEQSILLPPIYYSSWNTLYITSSWVYRSSKWKKIRVFSSIEMLFSLRLKGASSYTTWDKDISLKNYARWRTVLTHCPAIILKESSPLKQGKAMSWTRRECSNRLHVVWDLTFGNCCWHTHTHTHFVDSWKRANRKVSRLSREQLFRSDNSVSNNGRRVNW